jgi:hypothetical protein
MNKVVFAFCSVIATIAAFFILVGFGLISFAGWLAMKMED